MERAQRVGVRAAYVCERLDAVELQRLDADEWDALSAAALDPNPFYDRRYVLAGLAWLDEDARLEAVAIRDANRSLVGLVLYRRPKLPFGAARVALNRYQMSGVPLLDRRHAGGAIDAWFEAQRKGQLPALWQLPHLDLESGFARLCRGRLERHGMHFEPVAGYGRPRLVRATGGFAAHVANVLEHKRHREIQRTLRRLREQGELRFGRVTEAAQLAARLEDFLEIEHAGWKGRAGTSFLSEPTHAQFLRAAVNGNPQASIDCLLLDGRPIALSLNLMARNTLFTPKCAYDETYRRYSPGLVLEYFVIEAFHADPTIDEMDAATTVGGHLVGTLWNAERAMGTVLMGRRGWQSSLLTSLARVRVAGRAGARQLLGSGGVALLRQLRREVPDMLRRLAQLGQGVSCLLFAV